MTVIAPLYVQVMRDAWTALAEPVRSMHAPCSIVRAYGQLRIDRGRHPVARLVATMLRLPRSSAAAETRLTVTARADGEQWERTFDGRRVRTRQYDPHQPELAERFGVVEFRFALEPCNGSLLYVQRAASFVLGRIRVRIPDALAPRVEAREDPAGPNRVRVDVRVSLPFAGLLIAYHGTIQREDVPA